VSDAIANQQGDKVMVPTGNPLCTEDTNKDCDGDWLLFENGFEACKEEGDDK